MKILIVSQYFWPESFRINDLTMGLIEKGIEVEVLTGKPNYPTGRFFNGYDYFSKSIETWNGIKIRRSNLIPRGSGKGKRLAINYVSFFLLASLKAIFIRKRFDCVLVFGTSPITSCIPAIVYAKRKKVPVYLWVQDLWPESVSAAGMVKNKLALNSLNSLTKWIYRNCHKLLIQSRAFSNYILNQGVCPEKLIYFPNWAEDIYKPVNIVDKSIKEMMNSTGFKLLFAGNIGAAQNLEIVLEAIKIVIEKKENFHFYILGDGRRKSQVIQKIQKLRLYNNVHLLGSFAIDRMPAFFSEADALLVSLKDEMIFNFTVPSKIQSYLACGKPIIGFLNGEGANIIKESGAGFVVSSPDYQLLAEKLLDLSKLEKEKLSEIGSNGLKYYENNFNRDKLILDLIEMLKL